MVTLVDAIYKAYQELARALQGMSNIIGQANLEALKQMEPKITFIGQTQVTMHGTFNAPLPPVDNYKTKPQEPMSPPVAWNLEP